MFTPQSELPSLPNTVPSYWPIHAYTLLQIVLTVVIFIITLTKAGPSFPIIILLLVPVRLLIMNRIWNRETLRHVDAWACRDGTPEDDEDKKLRLNNAPATEPVTDDIELAIVSGSENRTPSNEPSSRVSFKI
jgi:hypothetical protein